MLEGKHLNASYAFKIIIRTAHILPMFKLHVSFTAVAVSI